MLYDRLKEIVSENRCLAAVDQRKILGSEADREVSFYSAQLPRDRQERERWVGDAVETVRGKDIIFCDPDTGLVPQSKRGNSPQHVLASEIELFLGDGTIINSRGVPVSLSRDAQEPDRQLASPPGEH